MHNMQDEMSIVPLSSYGKPYTPPAGKINPGIDMDTPVRDQVHGLSAEAYFKLLAMLMTDNPPAKADEPIMARMKKIGIVPGKAFDIAKLNPAVAKAIDGVPRVAQEKIMAHFKKAGDIREWLDIHDPDGCLRHRLPATGPRHGHRPRGKSAAGCGLSNIGGGCRRQAI